MRALRTPTGPLIKSAIFVVVTGLATAILAVSVSNTGLGDTVGYRARFTDVTSLNPGDDVRIAGVRVGQVDKLTVVDGNIALADFSVNRDQSLPADLTATIKYRNMVGQRYIALGRADRAGGADDGAGSAPLAPGAEIPLGRTTPALDLTDLFNGFKPLFQALSPNDVNQLSGEIVQVLQGEGGTVHDLLTHTGSLTATLAGRDQVIGQVITNLNTVLATVNGQGDALSTLIGAIRELVSGLSGDRAAIGGAIDGIASLTSATAGLFSAARPGLKDSIAGLGALSSNLVTGSADLERFLVLLPDKFEAVGRTASYGSWFNFFLCSATVHTDPAQGLPVVAGRCQR
jgi:phospholipid/cholesterol/gamma-HCH transport system substrate-binding protein